MRFASFLLAGAAGFALAGSASAFDCAKASTDTEKAICADPALKASDDAMGAAYETALARLEPEQQSALKANQKVWLTARDSYCSADEGRAVCLKDYTDKRTRFLGGAAESGPGLAVALTPFIVSKPQSKTSCAGDVAVHIFGAAAKTAAERDFDTRIKQLASSVEDENGVREVSPDYEYDCSWSLDSTVTYGSPDIVAVAIDMYTFGGGAHGNYGRLPLVVDLRTGKSPEFATTFPDSAKPELVAACTAGIREEKAKRYAEAGDPESVKELMAGLDDSVKEYAETITAGVSDLSHWIVYEDRAEVYFAPYELGSYAEGDYTCALPKALLVKASAGKWIVP